MATYLDVSNCIDRIIMKRSQREASIESLASWLNHMKTVWKNNKSVLNEIDKKSIKLTDMVKEYTT